MMVSDRSQGYKPCLVVGGGIVGMVASYLMSARKREVVLVEASPHLGGLLRGPCIDGRYFDHGTHSLASTGVPEMDEFLLSAFSTDQFNLFQGHDADRSGSFSSAGWNENTSFADTRSGGIAEDIIDWRRSNEAIPKVNSAYDELQSLYGSKAAPFFAQVMKSVFGRDPRDLGVNAVKLLALHRTVLMSNEDIQICADIDLISPVIAHPDREKFNRRPPPETRSIYPKTRNLGLVIDKLEAKLELAGVKVLKQTRLERSGNDYIAKSTDCDHQIKKPEVIWTAGVPAAANFFLNKKFVETSGDLVCWIAHVEISKKLRKLNNYYYFIRHPNLRTYRLTNYSALTADNFDMAYTLEMTVPKTYSEAEMVEIVKDELLTMGLIESADDIKFVKMNRLNYSFLNATKAFENWCGAVVEELRGHVPMFGPWSSRGLFFTGDCLRDLHSRLFRFI
jgi:protoporphyrinogen oxidase